MAFERSGIWVAIFRFAAALILSLSVIGLVAQWQGRDGLGQLNVFPISQAEWVDDNYPPVLISTGKDLGFVLPSRPLPFAGMYRLDVREDVARLKSASPGAVPAIYLPAIGCATQVKIGGYEFGLDRSDFSSVGPVIPLMNQNDLSGQEWAHFVDIYISCKTGYFAGLWRAKPVVGDLFTLVEQQKRDSFYQIQMPFFSALLSVLLSLFFGVLYQATERVFSRFLNMSIGFSLNGLFLFALSGQLRAISFQWGSLLHMPICVLSAFGVFQMFLAYSLLICDRPISQNGYRFTFGSLLLLFLLTFAFAVNGNIEWHLWTMSIGIVIVYWPIFLWPLTRIRILSSEFVVVVAAVTAAISALLDAFQIGLEPYSSVSWPYFNRISLSLFAAVSLVFFLRDFVRLYRDHKTSEIKAAKAGAFGRAVQMVAHDVRKPFTTLRFGLDLLEKSLGDPERTTQLTKRLGEEVRKSLNRVNSMLADIMSFGAHHRLNCEEINVRKLVDEVSSEVLKNHPTFQGGINIEADSEIVFFGDFNKIFRTIFNIVENAVQACRGGDRVSVTAVAFGEKDAALRMVIHNTGSFISAEKRQKIFEDFFTEGKSSGTGLGLAVAREIVEAHGGTVRCHSDERAGTSFEIVLPMSGTALGGSGEDKASWA